MPRRAKRGAERTPLQRDSDVLVCGASFAGLAVARELAGAGARVLVVDRYEIEERQTSACGIPTRWLYVLGLESSLQQTSGERRQAVDHLDHGHERMGGLQARHQGPRGPGPPGGVGERERQHRGRHPHGDHRDPERHPGGPAADRALSGRGGTDAATTHQVLDRLNHAGQIEGRLYDTNSSSTGVEGSSEGFGVEGSHTETVSTVRHAWSRPPGDTVLHHLRLHG